MNTVPFEYQEIGARRIKSFNGRCLLADDMGLGKTIQALMYLHRHPHIRPVVVVCPASLKWNWQREALHHFSWRGEVLDGMTPPEWGVHVPDLLFVNYDILAPQKGNPGWLSRLKEIKPQCVVLDECQAVKNPGVKRTKAIKALCKGVPHVLALSGTPLTNRPAELWSVLHLLRPDVFDDQRAFLWKHCDPVFLFGRWQYRGAKRLPELHAKLKETCMVRRLKQDVLKELPQKSHHFVTLPLSDPAQYRQAHNDFLLWLAQNKPEKINQAARAERLSQIGHLKRLAADLKLNAVIDWIDTFLEDSGEKIIVFAIHKAVIKRLRERYTKRCVVIDGSTRAEDRRIAVDRFQKAPSCRVFIGNIHAAGVGITLTAASTVLFAELDWTPAAHSQGADRANRIGQTRHCMIYYAVGYGTIEEKLVKVILEKQSVVDTVLDGVESQETETIKRLISDLYSECGGGKGGNDESSNAGDRQNLLRHQPGCVQLRRPSGGDY